MVVFCYTMSLMDSLATLLPNVLQKRGIKDEAIAAHIVHCATQWLHEHLPDFREEVEAKKFMEETLVLSVSNPIAAQECQSLAHDLLSSLQKDFPSLKIEKVRIMRQ